jgi:hypothetical protein
MAMRTVIGVASVNAGTTAEIEIPVQYASKECVLEACNGNGEPVCVRVLHAAATGAPACGATDQLVSGPYCFVPAQYSSGRLRFVKLCGVVAGTLVSVSAIQ